MNTQDSYKSQMNKYMPYTVLNQYKMLNMEGYLDHIQGSQNLDWRFVFFPEINKGKNTSALLPQYTVK